MEQAMQEVTGTIVTYAIYGVLFLMVLTLLKILVRRKTNGLLGFEKKNKKGKSDKNYSETLMERGSAYVARTHLMTPTERDVFKVIERGYGVKYHIFCQVRVVDLIQPNTKKYHSKSKEYMSLFRQISQWHFDYVLCDKQNFKVFCALELDDASHNRADRKKRDRILNRACKEAGLRLERMTINHKNKEISLTPGSSG